MTSFNMHFMDRKLNGKVIVLATVAVVALIAFHQNLDYTTRVTGQFRGSDYNYSSLATAVPTAPLLTSRSSTRSTRSSTRAPTKNRFSNSKFINISRVSHSDDVSKVTSFPVGTIEWYGDTVLRERKSQISTACASLRSWNKQKEISWNLWSGRKKPRLFYSKEKEILVCDTPKCGSSQWRGMILILDGLVNETTADELQYNSKKYNKSYGFDFANKKRFFWSSINTTVAKDRDRANKILNTYYKIMIVREPLERLVSAYKEKLEKEGNYYYTPISKNIHKKYSKYPVKSGLASFSEFVDFILAVKFSSTLDVHWMPYTDLCDPCRMAYDYVAKMETLEDDIDYITTKLGIDRRILFDESKSKSLRKKWDSKYFKYYDQLTPAKRIAIFEYYKPQYDFFGYKYPEFITKLLNKQYFDKNRTLSRLHVLNTSNDISLSQKRPVF